MYVEGSADYRLAVRATFVEELCSGNEYVPAFPPIIERGRQVKLVLLILQADTCKKPLGMYSSLHALLAITIPYIGVPLASSIGLPIDAIFSKQYPVRLSHVQG